MALSYSCNVITGAVILWSDGVIVADLSEADGDFDVKVLWAKCICEAVNLRMEWLEAGRKAEDEATDEELNEALASVPWVDPNADPQDLRSDAEYWEEMRQREEEAVSFELPATRKQLNYLESLIYDLVEGGMEEWERRAGKHLSELSRNEASEWIGKLSGRAA